MIDINAIINNAITAAVDEAIKPLVERIEALEQRTLTLSSQDVAMGGRIEALENIAAEYTPAPVVIDEAKMVEALNSQEWFWEKINTYARGSVALSVEAAMDNHVELYNHDEYDDAVSKINDVDFDEIPDSETIEDTIKQVLNNAALRIRF